MNIADVIKKQTDAILRQRSQGPTGSPAVIVQRPDGSSSVGTPGTAHLDLAEHKISGDHDGRYPLKSELNAHKISNDHDGRYPLKSELNAHKISNDHDGRYPRIVREAFSNTDDIVVTHNFGRRPIVQVIGGFGVLYGMGDYGGGNYGGNLYSSVIIPAGITHVTVNQVSIILENVDTGEVILIG